MEERFRWLTEWQEGIASVTELCRKYSISRKTAYKWLTRYEEQGAIGLVDRSSTPLHSPTRITEAAEQSILEARRAHPSWGPKKLVVWLGQHWPEQSWPAESTIAAILARQG